MKATKLVTFCALPLIGVGLFAGIVTHHAHAATHQPGGQSIIYDKNGHRLATIETDDTAANQALIVTDRAGHTVKPVPLSARQAQASGQPQTVKYLAAAQSYRSKPFSGVGMHYGEHQFAPRGTQWLTITVKTGTFTLHQATDASNAMMLTPSGSPYKARVLHGTIFFGAHNPTAGATYVVKAM